MKRPNRGDRGVELVAWERASLGANVGSIRTKPESMNSLIGRLSNVRKSGKGWTARCPAHEDKKNSLSVNQGNDGRILLKCFAGCDVNDVCAALGITVGDLYERSNGTGPQKTKIIAEYSYTDETGKLLYQNVRLEPKVFRHRRPVDGNKWIWNLEGVRRVIYRLPEILKAEDVLIVEGEKDVQTGEALGFTGTTSGAAGTWKEEFSEWMRGKRTTIIQDADTAGGKHARQVAGFLTGKAESIKVIELPGAKDLSEWVERGGTREDLINLIQGAPEWNPQSIDADAMLNDVFTFIRRYVSMSPAQARVVTLWIVHTHVIAAADATPYLAITSAEKQSGKTRSFEVCDLLVAKPWLTGRVTAAVLIRKIDGEQPTLLLDESDAAFSGEKEYAEALRGVLNTGHRRGGKASCCVGQGSAIGYKDFSTFCPKAIAGIGSLPDTVADRSIPIRLKRAARGEHVERFRRRDVENHATELRALLEAWSLTAIERLRNSRPILPDALSDRQQDGAEPLLAIAELAGGEWPEIAREALVELCSSAQARDESIGVRLLADIKDIFKDGDVDRIPSADLAAALAEIETSPWGEWGKAGKPISAAKLARLLRAVHHRTP